MATTTNYGWDTPDDTDLVKDGAAAIRTLGSSADTTVKNLSPGTTAGDLDYYTSGTAKARLGIGTAGQILQVNSGATAPEWADAGGAGKSFALLNTGGTSLSGASTTISSLSGYDQFFVVVDQASATGAAFNLSMRLSGDTGDNYNFYGARVQGPSSYTASTNGVAINSTNTNNWFIGRSSSASASVINAGILISGANSTGVKVVQWTAGSTASGGNDQSLRIASGTWNNTSVVSSMTFFIEDTYDSGTVYIYGAV
jgi:hypothetical protein